jgi:hypothetical protein
MNAMLHDKLPIRGFLTIYEAIAAGNYCACKAKPCIHTFRKGKVLHADPNIITTLGRVRVAELLTGLSTDFVNEMALGDGGAPQTDLLVPIVPVLSDSALAHELKRTNIVNAAVVGQVLTFTASFLTASLTPIDFISPANQVVNEAGLFCIDGILFARKTFPSIPFSPVDRVGVIAEWSIEVL